jgi:hypothetical protein
LEIIEKFAKVLKVDPSHQERDPPQAKVTATGPASRPRLLVLSSLEIGSDRVGAG